MSRIKSKDTKPELAVRSFLHRRGFRYALHRRDLPGTPDIVLPRYGTIVFIHGCLWHGHIPCSKYLPPKTRKEYWRPKMHANRRRDSRQIIELKRLGWRVFVLLECQVNDPRLIEGRLCGLLRMKGGSGRRIAGLRSIPAWLRILRFEIKSTVARLRRTARRMLIRRPPDEGRVRHPSSGFDPMDELRTE